MKKAYKFNEGSASQFELLGGKGANLCEMTKLGLPIPEGIIIPTTLCVEYMEAEPVQSIQNDIIEAATVEALTWMGDSNCDLVSVRSGARISMPGMMDTILNVGMVSENLPKWVEELGPQAAYDCYRRLIQMYGEVVAGIPAECFADILASVKCKKYGLDNPPEFDSEMSVKHLVRLIERYKEEYVNFVGSAFPDNVNDQMSGAIEAVFKSWNGARAIAYRKAHKIPDDWGTAVIVQRMVYGNRNDKSCAGVLFSRNPATGEKGLMGEFLPNAQGEDVVAGIRTPISFAKLAKWNLSTWEQLVKIAIDMENHYKDMQDMEFTVENGKLWILQTRNGKRSAMAAFKIAHDMVNEELITKAEAIKRVTGKQYAVLKRPQIDPSFKTAPNVTGIPASNGIVSGIAVFSKEAAIKCKENCILVREETTPDDFPGMMVAKGILTTTGGATSHAAVVARGMDKACVVGASELNIGTMIKEGQTVTLDGNTGRVWIGMEVPVLKFKMEEHVRTIMGWASEGNDLMIRVAPRFENSHTLEQDAAKLPDDGRIYIETGGTDVGNSTKYAIANLLLVMKTRKGLSGILDLGTVESNPEDDAFMGWLGASVAKATDQDENLLGQKIITLLQKRWTNAMKKRWVLALPKYAFGSQIEVLKGVGWRIVTTINTLSDLVEADGYVDFTDDFIERMANFEKIPKEGIEILLGNGCRPMPKTISKEQLAFEVLGK